MLNISLAFDDKAFDVLSSKAVYRPTVCAFNVSAIVTEATSAVSEYGVYDSRHLEFYQKWDIQQSLP